jgi:hypothetical protein
MEMMLNPRNRILSSGDGKRYCKEDLTFSHTQVTLVEDASKMLTGQRGILSRSNTLTEHQNINIIRTLKVLSADNRYLSRDVSFWDSSEKSTHKTLNDLFKPNEISFKDLDFMKLATPKFELPEVDCTIQLKDDYSQNLYIKNKCKESKYKRYSSVPRHK